MKERKGGRGRPGKGSKTEEDVTDKAGIAATRGHSGFVRGGWRDLCIYKPFHQMCMKNDY